MLQKQIKITSKISILILLFLVISSCSKDDKNCGCESETSQTVSESDKMKGEIAFKYQIDPNDNYYNDKFWINFTPTDCSSCDIRAIICNEDILDEEISKLKETEGILSIQFSGFLKEICTRKNDIAEISYKRIVLTSIEISE